MTQRSTKVVEPQAPAVESRTEPSTAAGAEEPAAEEEAQAELLVLKLKKGNMSVPTASLRLSAQIF
jgi:hypothetical protein